MYSSSMVLEVIYSLKGDITGRVRANKRYPGVVVDQMYLIDMSSEAIDTREGRSPCFGYQLSIAKAEETDSTR